MFSGYQLGRESKGEVQYIYNIYTYMYSVKCSINIKYIVYIQYIQFTYVQYIQYIHENYVLATAL